MRAIVLSGGGAKGAYEAGVWKALKRLHIKFDIVTGTSIGALNGMMMVQKDYYKCMKLWKNISFEQLYDNFVPSKEAQQMYLNYLNKIIDGGIDTEKIQKIIEQNYNPRKMYSSKVSFGVVAYNLSNRDVVYATKKNTRPDKLKKYILASATCFPVFKPVKIGTDTFVDGGYYDNLPINLAIELGADEIIAVDLGAVGFHKKVKDKKVKITYIAPNNRLDSFLLFESNAAKRMIRFGYNDTMKVFGKFEGNLYTFKKGTLTNHYYQHQNQLKSVIHSRKEFQVGNLKRFINSKNSEKIMNDIVEDALELFKVRADAIYGVEEFRQKIWEQLENIEEIKLDNFNIEEIKKLFNQAAIVKYIYQKLNSNAKINYTIFSFFTKEFTTAVYLLATGRKKNEKYINRD